MSIEAMKQALEALALFASDESDEGQIAIAAHEALRQAIEQAEKQKPVAWFEYNPDLEAWFLAYHPNTNPKVKTRPLYTAPSQREWVGLTMEDVNELYENYDPSQWYDFLRDVEAKLKEKNS